MSRPTKTLLGAKAKHAVLEGVNLIYETAGRTLGPEGKNALLYHSYNRGPRITNDGYTVAEVQEPQNIHVRLATQIFKESCKKTNIKVGDGTTTTAVIGGKLFNDAYALLNEGLSDFTAKQTGKIGVQTLKKQILETAKLVKEKIKERARKVETVEELEKIAIISTEDREIGKTVAGMAWKVGIDGAIDVVEGYKDQIETELIEGMSFAAKIPANAFINRPEKLQMLAVDCPVFITNYALDNAADINKVFQRFNAITSKLIVVAPSFSENVMVNMVNAGKQGYFFYPVQVPSFRTDNFKDLAIYCDAKFVDKNEGMKFNAVTPEYLGFVEKLTVNSTENKEDARATGGRGALPQKQKIGEDEVLMASKVQNRIEELKGQLNETRQDNFKLLMQRRIAGLASAGGVIRVGDTTKASSYYTKLKIEDGVFACKAALRGGYVKGGGLCLKEIADELGENVLKNALEEPYKRIQDSAEGGVEITEDIIDPAEAVYWAVEHATQVVAQLVTVEIITPETEETMLGDSNLMVARALGELSLVMKRHFGLIKENEEEQERERMERMLLDDRNDTSDIIELSNHDKF
mgnify:FL=1